MRTWAWIGVGLLGAAMGASCSGTTGEQDGSCPVGAFECPCTVGGSCDPGLVCLDNRCLAVQTDTGSTPPLTDDGAMTSGMTMGQTGDTTAGSLTTTGADTTEGVSTGGGGPILDVGPPATGGLPARGCQAIDVLFAVDNSGSMAEERAALAATGSFTQIVLTLEGLNGGGIDYRIGVTTADDHGFLVPPGWFDPNPWFDSQNLTPMETADAFNGAMAQVGALGDPPIGCEHVLTSGTNLLAGDATGFLRDDALLVLVLLTDVDDYGAYDQPGGNTCGLGCATPPTVLADLVDDLLLAKNGQMDALSTIVVAGDPAAAAGSNFCDQPGSCGCVEVIPGFFDCDVFHATRLWQFAGMLGANGVTADLCGGPASVPTAIETALTTGIEIACESFEPEG
ncbi:MAG: hypothetical protein K0V04_17260 [Deltaproteobacteria bacterium]|nr:hypothetical protein [Deltaproteobacteria bacterium]